MKPKMSLMVGTKMTRALVPASRTMVMMVWRIQLNSLEAHRSWLTEVRIYRERERERQKQTVTTREQLNSYPYPNPAPSLRHLQGTAPRGRWGWRRSAQPDGRSAGWHRPCRSWSRCAAARAPRGLYHKKIRDPLDLKHSQLQRNMWHI